MGIRSKIVLVVLPLLIAALLVTGVISSFSARSGMIRIAMDLLGFKSRELNKYMENQWNLLASNGLETDPEYVDVAKAAVQSYANTIVTGESETIIALDLEGNLVMWTEEPDISIEEKSDLYTLIKNRETGWVEFAMEDKSRVGQAFLFQPFNWYVIIADETENFSREATEITRQSFVILGISAGVSVLLLLFFAGYLTRPIKRVVQVMRDIITTNDLSRRVAVEYKDEIGDLAHTFNIMTNELEKARKQITEFAFQAVVAQKNEHKIRNIFQKYVPKDIIDSFFVNPESMLVGDNRIVAILFTDIRSFTTISEGYSPDELVVNLNRYFEFMVDIIMEHGGVVDKYIGDAIMAFFGAPVKHEDDAYQAVVAGLKMQLELAKFNEELVAKGKPKFITGIGINYGVVTVGNIGSEKKMDYTIIGDMVNLGSRLEGLTKTYKQEVIFSESVYRKVHGQLPCRRLDKVVVKGKTQGESIYTSKLSLTEREEKAWKFHEGALKLYYARQFEKAARYFTAVRKLIPDDHVSAIFLERCNRYLKNPPPKDWVGLEILTEK